MIRGRANARVSASLLSSETAGAFHEVSVSFRYDIDTLIVLNIRDL